MPELPDLEVIRAVLVRRIVDVPILSAEVLRPLVVRNLLGGELDAHLTGRRFVDVQRRGKFLLLPLDDGNTLVIHPMLAGRLRYGLPLARSRTRDALLIRLADGRELRYNDTKDMGKVYLTANLAQVPAFGELGPEATDPAIDFGWIPGAAAPAARRDQGGAGRSGFRSRYRQRLCRRNPLARADLPVSTPGEPERRTSASASKPT